MDKINISYIDPIGEYTSYQDLIEGQRKRIEILESAMREFISEYTATVGRHDQFDTMEQDILLNAYSKKFRKMLEA